MTFKKQKDSARFLLSKFVKRFFVFDMSETRAIMYFNSSSGTDNPKAVIPFHSLIAVRKENPVPQTQPKARTKSGTRPSEEEVLVHRR